MPGRRRIKRCAHDNDHGQEGFDFQAPGLGGGMKPTKIAHAVLSHGQNVLQVAAHKLRGPESTFTACAVFRGSITKVHVLTARLQDPLVANGGATDIAGQITHDRLTGARGLSMYPPAFPPGGVGNLMLLKDVNA